jgi:hypothetical protein
MRKKIGNVGKKAGGEPARTGKGNGKKSAIWKGY